MEDIGILKENEKKRQRGNKKKQSPSPYRLFHRTCRVQSEAASFYDGYAASCTLYGGYSPER